MDFFRPYLRRKFTWVFNQLTSLIRNAVAHLDPMNYVLDPDKFEDLDKCHKAIPVLRYMARQMLDGNLKIARRQLMSRER